MAIQVPNQYIVSTGGKDWRADYVGSGKEFVASAGVPLTGDAEQFKVPEGTMVVASPTEACVLVTASPDQNAALDEQDPANYHLYRLTPLGQLR
jgi:hypothetical protein